MLTTVQFHAQFHLKPIRFQARTVGTHVEASITTCVPTVLA